MDGTQKLAQHVAIQAVNVHTHTHTHTHIYIQDVSEIGCLILDSLAVDQIITKKPYMNTYPTALRFFIVITLGNTDWQNLYFAACYNLGRFL